MKAGEEFKHYGKVYVTVLNLPQIINKYVTCGVCAFNSPGNGSRADGCPRIDGLLACGYSHSPVDEQVIFVEVKDEGG